MGKLERVKIAINELKVIGWEILTSTVHLIGIVPKFVSVFLNLVAEVDTIAEITELILEWFRNKSREAKNNI